MERASSDFGRQFFYSRLFSIDNNFLTVTDYTQLICGVVECVMPASLYSQQSCSFVNIVGLTPVLTAQNASKLMHHYKRTLNKKCGPQEQSVQVLEAGVI